MDGDKMRLGLVSLGKRAAFPPGSLVYIASYLKKHCGSLDIEIVDANFDDVLRTLTRGRFDLIGITAMTVDYGRAARVAQKVKQALSVPVIIGGVHISSLPSSLKPCFDLALTGEGEQTMLDLLRLFTATGQFRAEDLVSIPGVAFFDNGALVATDPRPPIDPLDEVPVPDWTLANPAYFKRRPIIRWGEYGVSGLLLTSRGCPYDCVFCSAKRMWGAIRFHSPEWVAEAVRDLALNHSVTHITIWDDLFCVDKARLEAIGACLRKEGLADSVKFACQGRANLIDEEMCQILRAMNVRSICFGVESGSQRVLKSLKTGQASVKQNARAIELCGANGIESQVSVILGSPGETMHDMRQTVRFLDFAVEHGTTQIQAFVMTPYPGTVVWEMARERGKVGHDMDWESLSLFSDDPLLLDESVSVRDFRAVLSESRAKARRLTWRKKVLPLLRRYPLQVSRTVLRRPFVLCETLLGWTS